MFRNLFFYLNTMQGPVLLKSIPEHSDIFDRNLRQDICRAVGGIECVTNNPRGVDKILNCMREIFGVENVLLLGFKVFKEFKECERKEGQCMRSFIFEFDHKYRRCKRIDMVFQDVMLYVILLSAANLNKNQRMLFKAVFNIEQDNLYERMKQTMMRLFSNNI